ncbi:MAG: ASCH domain-containing protein [Solirubrobacterales bacterium]
MTGSLYALNFFSPAFVDQLRRGRKTATIRLGDKSRKYERGHVVWITVGQQHSPREKIFSAVIDDVDVKRVKELSPRDVEHDNPEFRRVEETISFLEQIYGRDVTMEDTVTVVRFSQIVEPAGPRFGNGETPSRN